MQESSGAPPNDQDRVGRRSVLTVGVAGGGQLAQMMVPAARKLGLKVVVLDPDANCSAAEFANATIVDAFDSVEGLRRLGAECDVVTIEIEKVNADGLAELERQGRVVRPSSATLRTIQDKLLQKQFLLAHDIPTSGFIGIGRRADIKRDLPCVWKSRRDGYDGRGVAVLRNAIDVAAVADGPALLEDLVDIDVELAILIARDSAGRVMHYPVVEIIMDDAAHVMESVIAPAAVDEDVAARCRDIATQVAHALNYVGILAIEFFVARDGAVFVNELSPRPHNSGHYTIEACVTSQFEQHLRAVADLGLASSELLSAAVCFNVLGAEGPSGTPRYIGFDARPASEQIYIHNYDKPQVRAGRKMGHVTVLAPTREEAIAKAERIKPEIRVECADE